MENKYLIQELRQFTDLPQPSREQKTKNPNPFTRFGFLFMNGREGIRTLESKVLINPIFITDYTFSALLSRFYQLLYLLS